MPFTFRQKVLFKHCDPAGIVFYPRYFEMINDAVETLFCDVLQWPFEEMHKDGGVPTASFNVTFTAPSRHGDLLDLNVAILRLGGSSMTLKTTARAGDQTRFVADQVIVNVDGTGRPRRWPESLRTLATPLLEGPK